MAAEASLRLSDRTKPEEAGTPLLPSCSHEARLKPCSHLTPPSRPTQPDPLLLPLRADLCCHELQLVFLTDAAVDILLKKNHPVCIVSVSFLRVKASLITNPDDFVVGKYVGEYGFMNVASYSSFQPGGPSDTKNIEVPNIGYSSEDIERLRIQYIGEGKVKMRLYEGRVVKDMMVANELNCHASLQEDSKIVYENIQILSPDPSSRRWTQLEPFVAASQTGKPSTADVRFELDICPATSLAAGAKSCLKFGQAREPREGWMSCESSSSMQTEI
ncbi:hypothetical protein IEQ34_015412 [Dendrobium chrysotoxum]|uniref:Uncharacterized protein n=1 Tax=Dendrobium chrysotoxum TaxID=161865 RepID=A0AAV7GGM7_DENCH|nr:hypothetical protein IEQ34_015412 [Dendrobium chrysotoxum]